MGYQTPKITSNGEGMWDTTPTPAPFANRGNPTGGENFQGGQNPKLVSYFNNGSAEASSSGSDSPDQGSGSANKPSPAQSLLSTIRGSGSSDQGKDPANTPSPNQSLLNTRGKNGIGPTVRTPSLGGVEKGVQIQ